MKKEPSSLRHGCAMGGQGSEPQLRMVLLFDRPDVSLPVDRPDALCNNILRATLRIARDYGGNFSVGQYAKL
jgi:hypothetical protein